MTQPRTPNDLARSFAVLRGLSKANEVFFRDLDVENAILASNANYIALQASEYHQVMLRAAEAQDPGFLAFAKSELSRILAIAMRECIANNWDFIEVLSEGVQYEQAVILDINEGRRTRDSHRGRTNNAKDNHG